MEKRKRYQKFNFRSHFMETFLQDLNQSMRNITALLKKNNIRFCFIGGAILSKYNYDVTTRDIDILVDKNDKSKFKKLENEYYISPQSINGPLEWIRPKVDLDVMYSGNYAGNNQGIKYEDPDKISHKQDNLPILDLKYLIQYKLSSGIYDNRFKDFGHIQELIKLNSLPENYADDFREDLKNKYIEIWNAKKI